MRIVIARALTRHNLCTYNPGPPRVIHGLRKQDRTGEMKSFGFSRLVFTVLFVCISFNVAHALSRGYVAESGKDTNPCTPAKPCRTVARALSAIGSRGTVTLVENGEYPAFTVTSSQQTAPPGTLPPTTVPLFITVEAAPGVVANITGEVGGVPIDVNASSQDALVLRNLHIDIMSGSIGIACSGIRALYIESCFVSGFNVGINFKAQGRLFLRDSVLKENATAVVLASANGRALISIDHCRMEDNGLTGLDVESGADVVMRNSVIANSAHYGVIFKAATANNPASLFVEDSLITGGAYNCLEFCKEGIGLYASGEVVSKVWLSNSVITDI